MTRISSRTACRSVAALIAAAAAAGAVALGTGTASAHPTTTPQFTSASTAPFTQAKAATFQITTSDSAPASFTEQGTLPAGLQFSDNQDGTAAIYGRPTTASSYTTYITVTARDGLSEPFTQKIGIIVSGGPQFISPDHATFTTGHANTFTVRVPGDTDVRLSQYGTLPAGISFHDNGNGTATLSGTPTATGTTTTVLAATDGLGAGAHQTFTLTVA